MNVLAIDTALPAVSACVFDAETDDVIALETIAMERGHAEALLPLIDRVIARIADGFAGLDKVAVTVGPGSFTGLRVGIAAARAIGLACKIPVVGVSTLAALAAPLILEEKPGKVAVAIDARHGNLYFALFDADGHAVFPPNVLAARDAARLLGSEPVRAAGSGAAMLAIEAWAAGVAVEVIGDSFAPDITFVARLGLLAAPAHAPARPLYLKAPDAKPQDASHIPLATP